jgi:hypothetical protein
LFERERSGVGPHCSFCGSSTGPFREVEGLFTVLMCEGCLAARRAGPAELLADHDAGEPWLKWGCPLEGCGHRAIGPWELTDHTAAEHPGWEARYELLRPYPNQLQRVVVRRVDEPPAT